MGHQSVRLTMVSRVHAGAGVLPFPLVVCRRRVRIRKGSKSQSSRFEYAAVLSTRR